MDNFAVPFIFPQISLLQSPISIPTTVVNYYKICNFLLWGLWQQFCQQRYWILVLNN